MHLLNGRKLGLLHEMVGDFLFFPLQTLLKNERRLSSFEYDGGRLLALGCQATAEGIIDSWMIRIEKGNCSLGEASPVDSRIPVTLDAQRYQHSMH